MLQRCQRQTEPRGRSLFPLLCSILPGLAELSLSRCRGDAVVISGRKLARQIRQEARHEVQQWVAAGNRRPHLSVVLVGENPASHSYVLNKTKAAADVGEWELSCPFGWESSMLAAFLGCTRLLGFQLHPEFGFWWLPGCIEVWLDGISWILWGRIGVFQLSQSQEKHKRGFLASFPRLPGTQPLFSSLAALWPHPTVQGPAQGQGNNW